LAASLPATIFSFSRACWLGLIFTLIVSYDK
jgi:hypothetical protein